MKGSFGNFTEVLKEVKGLAPVPTAVIDADEAYVLEGACEAAVAGFIDPILIGEEKAVRKLLDVVDCKRDFTIINAERVEDMAEKGVELVEKGQAMALMKGHLHTDEFMHPILAHHLQGKHRISHVFIADLATYPKLLFITDAAVNISPDLITKKEIAQNAVYLAQLMGVAVPKVAALSAVEVVTPAIPSTLDAACLAKMAQRGQIRNAIVDGPLAFDNAISAESAKIKGIESPVSGDVDILLVPDLESGNILGKDLEYLAGAQMAGIVLGAKVPIILTSRADPPRARLLSCAIASLTAHRMRQEKE
jgi:phosphate butyryltransferase